MTTQTSTVVGNVEGVNWAAGTALEREARPLEDMSVTNDAVQTSKNFWKPLLCGHEPRVDLRRRGIVQDQTLRRRNNRQR